jgi:GMP synthase-like glutamine amidotransferase
MKALILMHVEHEGPGTLGTFLKEEGVETRILHLYGGDECPAHPGETDLIVSMGGPMNVYEDGGYPFLAEEVRFLSTALKANIPVMGICLGAQIIARACGAAVYRAPVEEVGWSTVTITEEGRRDTLFEGVPREIPVLQWHGDTFDVPEGGTLLATSAACPNQAFRVGSALGLQFHLEVDNRLLADWFADSPRREEILARYEEVRIPFDETARRIYGRLAGLAGKSG